MQTMTTRSAPTIIAPRLQASPWIVLLVLTLGYFMIPLDTTIVNVALPTMEQDLHATFDQILWVVNVYMLMYAVLLITAGRLGDIFGPKRLLLSGVVLFTLASAACGLSRDADQLILFRLVQVIGAAILTPQTLAILPSIFPPERRGAAFGLLSSVAGLAVVVGPTAGGLLVTAYNWQAIFYLNLPVGIIALLATILLVPEVRFHRSPALDLGGVTLVSTGLFALIYALIESQKFAWGPISSFGAFSLGSTRWSVLSIYSLLVYAGLFFLLFGWWETRTSQPLLPLSLFKDRNFSVAILIGNITSFPLAMFIVLSIFLQSVLGMSAIHAGLTLIPTSLAIMVVAPIAGRLSDLINGKYMLLAGLTCAALGIGLTTQALALADTSWDLVLPLAVTGVGLGFVFAPLTTLAMRDIQPALAGAASGVLFTNRQVGQAVGSAVIGSALANGVAGELPRQAVHLVSQVPPALRYRFPSAFQIASHDPQNFGVHQERAVAFPAGTPQAIVTHVATLSHDVFSQAFLNAARPSLMICAGVLLLAALVAGGFRGERSIDPIQQTDVPTRVDAA